MGKKHKGVGRGAKKSAKKAFKTVKRHGPLTAALVAVGGVASSILASEKFRDGIGDLIGAMMTRAQNALSKAATSTSNALALNGEAGGDEEEERQEYGQHEEAHS